MDKVRYVGIDVSQHWLDVECAPARGNVSTARFDNNAAGHRALCAWITKRGTAARVVLEATGVYSFDIALALHRATRIAVMVANPRAIKDFRGALLQRACTDACAATVLRQFAQRMEFVAWTPPRPAVLELRAVARRLEALTAMQTQEKNRLHAASVSADASPLLRGDIEAHLDQLRQRIASLQQQARALVAGDPQLQQAYQHLCTIKGVGALSAAALLAELATLPAGLSARQWVAYAGLDPRPVQSGTSVQGPPHISKMGNVRLRRALFMPALVALRHNEPVQRFGAELRAKGKAELVIIVAVMRKLLHAIYGMLRTGTDFDPTKFRACVPGTGLDA
jgi:transposase